MELLGAKVVSVEEGQGTLSDAVNKRLYNIGLVTLKTRTTY